MEKRRTLSSSTHLQALAISSPWLSSESAFSSFKDLSDTLFHCPGVRRGSCLRHAVAHPKDREDDAYHDFLSIARAFPRASGIIINTFESLEPRAVEALRSGPCIPDGRTPPVYCVGRVEPIAWSGSTRSRAEASCSCALGALGSSPSASSKRLQSGWRGAGRGAVRWGADGGLASVCVAAAESVGDGEGDEAGAVGGGGTGRVGGGGEGGETGERSS
ncbi:UDP-glycosyltransferase 88F4-like protein [Cinnamomum micranthum f. kanehirae]|uniref:UDP-glycosyltransferase 88F4-like protein n=1 Tax=Cinnamomum micranthum f. kanehirae TaxID=337451 RepID=A0A3S3NCP2_9MAGN|nr:UDP-glycosyltransferase 88F4-like protein [Cinnamomum micranthum f. kanehirae]